MDPYLEPKGFCRFRDAIVEYNLAIIDQWLARHVDGIFFSDDWGTQRALLIHQEDWRKWYKPAYKTVFEHVRAGGAHVWMHLCGNVSAILPDLIDLGLNVLNPVQPQAMDIGGYIGATSHTIMPEAPLDNVIALYEASLEVQGRGGEMPAWKGTRASGRQPGTQHRR